MPKVFFSKHFAWFIDAQGHNASLNQAETRLASLVQTNPNVETLRIQISTGLAFIRAARMVVQALGQLAQLIDKHEVQMRATTSHRRLEYLMHETELGK